MNVYSRTGSLYGLCWGRTFSQGIYQIVDQEDPKRAITQGKRGFLTLPINELRDPQEGLAKTRDYP